MFLKNIGMSLKVISGWLVLVGSQGSKTGTMFATTDVLSFLEDNEQREKSTEIMKIEKEGEEEIKISVGTKNDTIELAKLQNLLD